MAFELNEEFFQKQSQMLEVLIEDVNIPKNVRVKLIKARDALLNKVANDVRVSNSIYALEEITYDLNLPMHARSIVWSILSDLEAVKENLRKS